MSQRPPQRKPPEEFQNFKALAEKLVRVPKNEVDRQKAVYEKEKGRGKGSEKRRRG
jgi:hypothetical protein